LLIFNKGFFYVPVEPVLHAVVFLQLCLLLLLIIFYLKYKTLLRSACENAAVFNLL